MAATITQNHLMMAEKDSVTQSTTEMTLYMWVCPKKNLEAVFEATFGV